VEKAIETIIKPKAPGGVALKAIAGIDTALWSSTRKKSLNTHGTDTGVKKFEKTELALKQNRERGAFAPLSLIFYLSLEYDACARLRL
jgi:hypothetical protein